MDARRAVGLPLLMMATILPACDRSTSRNATSGDSSGVPRVFVVNYPLAYFAQRIGGDAIEVVQPFPADQDPAFWQPQDEQIRQFQQADLILLNGAGYARWVERASLPESKLVDTSEKFADQFIEIEDAVTHSHGPQGEHSHAGTAFTVWLDPELARLQAARVRDALLQLLPGQAQQLQRNFAALDADLTGLQQQWNQANQAYQGQPLLASHPVYSYLTRRCQWDLQSVTWEPHEMPDDDQWSRLQQQLAERPAGLMLWEAPPRDDIVQRLAELNVRVVVVDPCGNRPSQGDWLSVMRANTTRFAAAIAP